MTELPTILVVDDEQSIRDSFKLILSGNYNILTAASGEAGVKYAADEKVDLAFLDIRMPGMDGIETLKRMKELNPDLLVIMVTAVNDVQKASEAIRIGAYDYVVKPFDVNHIIKVAADLILRKNMLEESRRAGARIFEQAIIGTSEKMESVRRKISEAASRKGGVLIIGAEGVEREAVARGISPCIVHDARTSITALFGKSGGSTVADLKKEPGVIDLANNGDIFIDHAELLPNWAQEKLLKCDNRIFLGTSTNLKEKGCNPELYDRISETIIEIPSLLDRASDIPQIVEYYIEEANRRYSLNIKGISQEAQNLLSSYFWPGNIRQLAAVIMNAALLNEKPMIEAEDLPFEVIIQDASFYPLSLEDIYSQAEKRHIDNVLKAAGQNKEKAAKILGITTKVLESKI